MGPAFNLGRSPPPSYIWHCDLVGAHVTVSRKGVRRASTISILTKNRWGMIPCPFLEPYRHGMLTKQLGKGKKREVGKKRKPQHPGFPRGPPPWY